MEPTNGCPSGKHWNADLCVCLCDYVLTCDENKHFDYDKCECVCNAAKPDPIPSGMVWDDYSCKLVCGAGVTNDMCCDGVDRNLLAQYNEGCCEKDGIGKIFQIGTQDCCMKDGQGLVYTLGDQCCDNQKDYLKVLNNHEQTQNCGKENLNATTGSTGIGPVDAYIQYAHNFVKGISLFGFGPTTSLSVNASAESCTCCTDGSLPDEPFDGVLPCSTCAKKYKVTVAIESKISIPAFAWQLPMEQFLSPLRGRLKVQLGAGIFGFVKGGPNGSGSWEYGCDGRGCGRSTFGGALTGGLEVRVFGVVKTKDGTDPWVNIDWNFGSIETGIQLGIKQQDCDPSQPAYETFWCFTGVKVKLQIPMPIFGVRIGWKSDDMGDAWPLKGNCPP
jgi:hypothetical protein